MGVHACDLNDLTERAMLLDLSLSVDANVRKDIEGSEKLVSFGHLGTHFDVMNKEFPLEFTRRNGIVFDVSGTREGDIEAGDFDIQMVEAGMFVALRTGYIEKERYGTQTYFREHPQLSDDLIEQLLDRGISILAVDCAGIRRGEEHTRKDQYCADRGVFIVENVCRLDELLGGENFRRFTAHTYPINFANMTGLPCRVVAEID